MNAMLTLIMLHLLLNALHQYFYLMQTAISQNISLTERGRTIVEIISLLTEVHEISCKYDILHDTNARAR